jgi:hypothetical protein
MAPSSAATTPHRPAVLPPSPLRPIPSFFNNPSSFSIILHRKIQTAKMKTIRTEYQRLVELSETSDGWKEIKSAWNLATNQNFVDGKLLCKGESNGALVKGFAIDSITKQCMTSCSTYHSRAYLDMVDWISKNEADEDIDAIMSRPIKGWTGNILNFEFPCILMGDSRLFSDQTLLKSLEEAILDQNIGLPLNHLFISRNS